MFLRLPMLTAFVFFLAGSLATTTLGFAADWPIVATRCQS